MKRLIFLIAAILYANNTGANEPCDPPRVKIKVSSKAKTLDERKLERSELAKVLNELSNFSGLPNPYLDTYKKIVKRCPCVDITICYGDTSKSTGKASSGGTFVPTWSNVVGKAGSKKLIGGSLIVDKARLKKERSEDDYRTFLAEVITHEFYHVLEDCFEVAHNEGAARSAGEAMAKALDKPTLDETRPGPSREPSDAKFDRYTRVPSKAKTKSVATKPNDKRKILRNPSDAKMGGTIRGK